ncbi:chemotaxis protein CheB [Deinococcus depolymerans]|uniref:protein-glutamate methylesterase n=1 Tax=Deinococcus depolymerans TaxID=392408 RepID=A0ABN1CA22_9DEIO
MKGAPGLTVLVAADPQQRLEGARLLPAPRLLTVSVAGALAYLRREGLRGATLLLALPLPDLDLGWVRAQARGLGLRLIVVGGTPRPDMLVAPDLAAAAALCRGSVIAAPAAGWAAPTPAPDAGGAGDGRSGPRLTLIGASTGGPRLLSSLLRDLTPAGAVVIAQHISAGFGANLTQWLGTLTGAPVSAARDGLLLQGGHFYVAPDGHHVEVTRGALRVRPGRAGQEHLPSIDALFGSACSHRGPVTAALLTGMGSDGAEGLARLHRSGATTLVQRPDSATVPSMPQQALVRLNPTGVLGPAELRDTLRRLA